MALTGGFDALTGASLPGGQSFDFDAMGYPSSFADIANLVTPYTEAGESYLCDAASAFAGNDWSHIAPRRAQRLLPSA